ncbi:L,D-transpeptidase [Chelatococcus sambhunathii]|uniref:L,D-transpeptidase n=1 Tax=Chelatococcus sambhunathii TaxID=363953 RepID=A0ABU1DJ50_9HYPH|nr:L,D-transpeptidase [Chelatococcus sambhunathii]MDR4308035.1 L,D-transpeptidase [Chelatococcus sambhunathii]
MVRSVLGRGAAALAAVLLLCAPPAHARTEVSFKTDEYPGAVVIRNKERALYYVLGHGRAIRYPVAVGKRAKQWLGAAYVKGKYVKPNWAPPEDVKRDKPNIPDFIPGGSPKNPMGPRAIVLDRDQYAIHGTNRPSSIGTFASYGCIRMRNADVIDLFERVSLGTKVVVTP